MSGADATRRTALLDRCGERMARCILTYCIDGADALMVALLKGAPHAIDALTPLVEGLDDDAIATQHANHALERMFVSGAARWGCHLKSQGLQAFHRSLRRWRGRLESLPTWDHDGLRALFTQHGTQWVTIPDDDIWPERLADLSIRSDWAPPLCLWGVGDRTALTACDAPLAIVGSRGASEYGRHVAAALAQQAATAGHTVVSGGAMGTDASAHWGALSAVDAVGATHAGRTIAVFAGGLDHIGPSCNQRLFETMHANHGALISELCPGTIPEARRFLLRNRIIAALCPIVVVAQARRRSGALNTARWAAELNREIYAVPGNITAPDNAGCNELIRDHRAMLLPDTSIDDICHAAHEPRCGSHDDVADSAAGPDASDTALSDDQRRLLDAIRRLQRAQPPVTAGSLIEALRGRDDRPPTPDAVQTALGMLELHGLIDVAGGRITVRA